MDQTEGSNLTAVQAARSKKRVLIADDDPDIVLMLQYKLVQEGYQVSTAHDGQEAIDRISESRPDLIVLDLMMPKVDGWIICHSVKSTPNTAGIKIIILSAMSQFHAKNHGLAVMNADLYVTKPFDIDDLSEDIGNLLQIESAAGRPGETER